MPYTPGFDAAGFKAKPIGVATADLRTKTSDYDAPVNMGQSPAGDIDSTDGIQAAVRGFIDE